MPIRATRLLQHGGLGIGTDICHIPRITRSIVGDDGAISRQRLFAFNQHLLTDWEDMNFWQRYHNQASFSTISRISQFLAGRWAAKEALFKAWSPLRKLHRQNMEIRTHPETKTPVAVIADQLALRQRTLTSRECARYFEDMSRRKEEGLAREENPLQGLTIDVPEIGEGFFASISISHDGEYAFATAIAQGPGFEETLRP